MPSERCGAFCAHVSSPDSNSGVSKPIDHYIVDFVCLSHRLVIEVDGGQHAIEVDADARRTAYLEAEGFRVIRFWNNEVLENPEGVYERILEHLARTTPHPPGATRRAPPSPTRGEGA